MRLESRCRSCGVATRPRRRQCPGRPTRRYEMEFRVLGTFEVTRGGRVVTPSAPKLRRVLALLAVRANTLVHTHQLVDELWEDRPPPSSSTTLQTYIYQLRKLLGLAEQGQAAALHTRPS